MTDCSVSTRIVSRWWLIRKRVFYWLGKCDPLLCHLTIISAHDKFRRWSSMQLYLISKTRNPAQARRVKNCFSSIVRFWYESFCIIAVTSLFSFSSFFFSAKSIISRRWILRIRGKPGKVIDPWASYINDKTLCKFVSSKVIRKYTIQKTCIFRWFPETWVLKFFSAKKENKVRRATKYLKPNSLFLSQKYAPIFVSVFQFRWMKNKRHHRNQLGYFSQFGYFKKTCYFYNICVWHLLC